jgi:hypothetical protein
MESRAKRGHSDKALAAVGDAITSWSALEQALIHHLIHFVSHEAQTDESYLNTFLLVSGMSSETVVGLPKTFVRMEFPEAADTFDKLGNRINDASKNRRNTVAHKVWGPGSTEDKMKVWDIKTVGTFKMNRDEITATELRNWLAIFASWLRRSKSFFFDSAFPIQKNFCKGGNQLPNNVRRRILPAKNMMRLPFAVLLRRGLQARLANLSRRPANQPRAMRMLYFFPSA